jgi:2-amino-4-hydroxy-6-hydroxymethyldihydropteridine diphosphokinase
MANTPHKIYIALGSNLGSRLQNLRTALQALPPEVRHLRLSPVYQTPPWGITDQPAFLNTVLEAETLLAPIQLLDHLKKIEKKMGRVATVRNGPRVIDLDILFYDELAMKVNRLEIPHPHLEGRGFVLLPLADLVPELVHPVIGETITQMLKRCDLSGIESYPIPEGFDMLPDEPQEG